MVKNEDRSEKTHLQAWIEIEPLNWDMNWGDML